MGNPDCRNHTRASWRGVAAIVSQTLRMNSSGTSSWNRSDMELTNTRRGFAHVAGVSSAKGSRTILPVHFARPPLFRVVPAYLSTPMASRRAAMRIA
jgi:hypothetical protein